MLLAVPADQKTGSMNCDFERDYQYIHSINYFPASAFFVSHPVLTGNKIMGVKWKGSIFIATFGTYLC